MSKRGLGRGLSALIPSLGEGSQVKVVELSVNELKPNPFQPREVIDEEKIDELARSIDQHGVIQPIVVREASSGYEIVAGERRWRAAKKAGLERIPAIIRSISDEECALIALVENMMRENLNPVEEAMALKILMDNFKLKQEELANQLGLSRSVVANTLRILTLPDQIKKMLIDGKITKGHALAILSLDSPQMQLEVADSIVKNSLSVREAEKLVALLRSRKKKASRKSQSVGGLKEFEKAIAESTGYNARIKLTKRGIELKIKFSSIDKLEELVKRLVG